MPDSPSVPGPETNLKNTVLSTAAGLTQPLAPLKNICAHLNAFHTYADSPGHAVETDHYCAHLSNSVRQCLLYDSAEPNARLIGIEYMITPDLYCGLDAEERKLWHSHVFEVKSGMLAMPKPATVPEVAWEFAEKKEMEEVVGLYGKVFHLWDTRDALPLGLPRLMTSFTEASQVDESVWRERDERMGIDRERKVEGRKGIEEPSLHADADAAWKGNIAAIVEHCLMSKEKGL
nr:hypothetical protein B0A51_03090 [Rachicladosporium sp. CCFEE 5018]